MEPRAAETACGFQVRFDPAPSATELDHALAALSVACQAAAREANVLLDESVARQYLAVRNIPRNINQPKETEDGKA
jgi:hypothetical protein